MVFKALDDFNATYSTSVLKPIFSTEESVEWNVEDFEANGITTYNIIGFSYYQAFSPNVTINDIGNIMARLVSNYSYKQVLLYSDRI